MKIEEATKQLIRSSAHMLASGMKLQEVADAMGCSTETIRTLKFHHSNLWAREAMMAKHRRQLDKLKGHAQEKTPGGPDIGLGISRSGPRRQRIRKRGTDCGAYRRDQLWLTWNDQGAGPASIFARWNAMTDEQRIKECPGAWRTVRTRSVVSGAIIRARSERGGNDRDSWQAALEPPEKTLKGIRTATALSAAGLSWAEIAARMGVGVGTIHYYRDDHAETWRAEYDRAMQIAVEVVRREAGTDAILIDPREYIRRARACLRWTKAAGQELFAPGSAPTICSFLKSYVLPIRLSEASEASKELYEGTADLWAAFTGDPPLTAISCETLAQFKACLQRMPGKRRGMAMSPNTVRKHLKYVQMILDKAGPPGYRNRDAAGIISTSPPWIKPPRAEDRLPRFVNAELLGMAYNGAVAMEEPRLAGVKARLGGGRFWLSRLIVSSAGGRSSKCGWTKLAGTVAGLTCRPKDSSRAAARPFT